MAARVKHEWVEESAGLVASSVHDPLFELVHGLPGTGKSKVIAWIRELFTEVLGWSHGNQFVCLAFQNTMAANIDGSTIHSWADVPFQDAGAEGAHKARDIGAVFLRCQNLRWILLDEISMVSAELFAELERRVSQAARPAGTYKLRPDKSKRPFGGFNILLFGDWWQLRPVRSTALFDQPSKARSGSAYEGLQRLWGRNRDSLRRVWELTQPMRCVDTWYGVFCAECRNGALTADNYFYIHGVPTDGVGSMVPGTEAPSCGSAACAELQRSTWCEMFTAGAAWSEMHALECEVCQEARLARARVVVENPDPRLQRPPFDAAPYVHPHNVPKYYALQLRALEFAKQRGLCVNWVMAHDKPLHRDDQALSKEALDKKRRHWLGHHDQQTAGIMGLLPLVRGLPVRLTDTVNRGLKLVRHRQCTVVGWTLHPDEASAMINGERQLRYQPLCIYIKALRRYIVKGVPICIHLCV